MGAVNAISFPEKPRNGGEHAQDLIINGSSAGRKTEVCWLVAYAAGLPDMD